jgi:hypothetical protein
VTIEWPTEHVRASVAGPFVDHVDRESRRAAATLTYLFARRALPGSLPRPLPASTAGLEVRTTQAGSFQVVLDAYGVLGALASSNPVAIASLIQLLWPLRRGLRRALTQRELTTRKGRVADRHAPDDLLTRIVPADWDEFIYEQRETTSGVSVRIEARRR